MILDFYVDQDTLEFLGKTQIYTGSANYYKCRFRFSQDWDELKKIAVFRVGERFYEQLLEADCCAVPQEALDATGYTRIGIYGTTGGTEEAAEEGGWMRISTNWTKPLRLSEGAYQPDATAPVPPAPDVWEQYIAQVEQVLRKQPTIQNGNWMIYDFEAAGYVDTGVRAEFETADGGFAGGNDATAESGGAVGSGAIAGDGFAGGKNAATKDADEAGIDAIQLGTGTNSVPKSLQVYDYQLMDADGNVPLARIPQLSEKVDKVSGKGLSTNDYTDAEQAKLSGIEAGAEVNTVKSVCGKTGAVALGKEDVGLGNVDNTADLEKPVSAAMQAALSEKADKQNEYGGFAAGDRSESTEGGGAIGYDTYAFAGGAVGHNAKVTNAGGAVGADSEAGNGGAVGEGAKTSSGFAGGAGAQAVSADGAGIDAIQLGTGTNSTPKTLQVYSYQLMDADGNIPSARIPQLAEKVDKVSGKGLSTNDYTYADQEKVSHLPENTYDALYEKADKTALAEKADKTELIGKAGTWEGAEIFNDYENNAASMDYAHAEGQSTSASGACSHAEGFDTHAAAPYSHAEGAHTEAGGYGFGAHAEGLGTYALSSSAGSMRPQHVEGAYNIKDITIEETGENTYLHIAGNGTSDTNRSNAHTLDWDGNAWFAGKVTVGADAEELAAKSDLDAKADKETEYGGFAAGDGASALNGGAVGARAITDTGGAVGSGANAFNGGAVGSGANASNGGAVGSGANTSNGGAVGYQASAAIGGAIGSGAAATRGFSGGYNAKSEVDAIQLGTGTNSVQKSLQVYSHTVMNADGSLPYVHTARPYVEETLPAAGEVLALNTIYDLGTQTSVTLKLPSANVGNFIQVDFLCGDTPATFTIDAASSAIVSDYDFTPEPDKAYSLFFDYGRLAGGLYGWRFSYAEYTYTEV
ncbi:MAG TPA: hypothetical protein IAB04_05460 [Candidatus Avimonoglobus intestinipullorum]|uniref:Uncharacterized protein n=1 Tax=Candidatus Avimonoglobus intestinipullorum TaxID=2840699 RepID=A0A9D1LVM9_9FIRM|nr:hypothetical protein [Candidatus Avimonoglobus intestinipullorum]